MTDFRALCARMADELDHYRQLLMDDRRETHALATEARAALAEPQGEGPTAMGKVLARVQFAERQINHPSDVVLRQYCDDWFYGDPEKKEVDPVDLCRGAIQLFAQSPQPIPVSERLPGAEDCDAEGRCWAWDVYADSWVLYPARMVGSIVIEGRVTHWLPAHALPVPAEVTRG